LRVWYHLCHSIRT